MECFKAVIQKGWSDRLREAATVVISLATVWCFGSKRTLREVVAHERWSHFDCIYFRMDRDAC